jgi:TolB-like protein/Flp pilus assembly protein TadD
MNSRNFFAELRRRNVLKVAVAYVVAGWALSQGIAQVFPVFDVPNWVIRLIVLLIIIGLPIALVLGWMFELTPEGIKRTATADAMPNVTRKKKYVWMYVVVIASLVSIGLFFLGRYTATNTASAARTEAAAVSNKSIAVLPFDNLSRDPDNAYFAEGIQDEILARLSKIADLKVISRTSTQKYKSAPDNLREIARQLGVSNILEGSVQKAADQVRVNVQLINALNDAHLWSDIYDRKLTDIFAVESDIAKTVADTLQAKLTGSEQRAIAVQPTQSSEAHQLYVKGRYFWNKRTPNDSKVAITYFEQAIDLDTRFALAYAGLANTYVILPNFTIAPPRDAFPKAKAAAQKALELDNTLADAHTALARLCVVYEFDFPRALVEFKRAIELNPNYATAHQWLARLLIATGKLDEAISEAKRAVELDPLSLIINAQLGDTYVDAHRIDESIIQLRKTLELDNTFYFTHSSLGRALELKGLLDQAIAEYEKARQLNDDPYILAQLGHAYAARGRPEDARTMLAQLQGESLRRYIPGFYFAIVQLGLGNKEEALRWLEKTFEDRDGSDLAYIKLDPFLDPLRGDPRFEALVQKVFAEKH